ARQAARPASGRRSNPNGPSSAPYQTDPDNRAYWAQLRAKAAANRPAAPANEATCEICDGMGIVTKNVPIGHPDFGKAFPCRCQAGQGMVQQRLDRLFASSGLNKSQYNRYTLADYHQGAPAGLDVAVQAADRWACQARLSYEDLSFPFTPDLPSHFRLSDRLAERAGGLK
ncbi:MAG TPA: hypothetical protein VHP83_16335, partial [Aggregatilineaceae bacterium]|nr:hypothetical protein [Aggregatilineaceae bacterium]